MTDTTAHSLFDAPPASSRFAVFALLGGAAVVGCAALLYATRQGIGLWGDSLDYIAAARSIIAGRGVQTLGEQGNWEPLTVFPPFYPMLLSLSGLFHADPIAGARILHAVLFGGTLALAGGMAWSLTRSLPVAAAVCILSFNPLLEAFAKAQSEGPFIFLTLAALALMSAHLRRPRPTLLSAAALAAGAALLTRYAAVSLLAVGGLALLGLGGRQRRPLRRCWAEAVSFIVLASAPVMAWTRRIGSTAKATGRQMRVHPPGPEKLLQLLQTLGSWVVKPKSAQLQACIGIALPALVLAYLARHLSSARRRGDLLDRPLLAVLLLFALLYIPFLLVSISLFDALTPLNDRILSPLIVPATTAGLAMAFDHARRRAALKSALPAAGFHAPIWTGSTIGRVLAGVLALALAYKVQHAVVSVRAMHRKGIDYSNRSWHNAAILRYVADLPADQLIYSNAKDVLYLLGGRITRTPPKIKLRKIHQDTDASVIDREMSRMADDLIRNHGLLIFLDGVNRTDFLASPDMIARHMPLETVAVIADPDAPTGGGSVYRVIAPATRPASAR